MEGCLKGVSGGMSEGDEWMGRVDGTSGGVSGGGEWRG